MKIAIDFDGTIVEHSFPTIGKEKLFAFDTLRELQKQNHQLILWTSRVGRELDEAIDFCRARGVEFYAVNKNYPEEVFDETISRKIVADIYIDDRNIGGLPGWGEVWQLLNPRETATKDEINKLTKKTGKLSGFFKKDKS
jgi:hydroxymethylpyrimidine pyrophosphatase-like HAD family hydrolase